MKLDYFLRSKEVKETCFIIGVHGIDYTYIQIAYRLNEFLKDSTLNNEVVIILTTNLAGM